MKRIVLAFITTFIFLSGYGQPLPTKTEQYEFLKWYVIFSKPSHVLKTAGLLDEAQINAGDKGKMRRLNITAIEKKYLFRQIAANQQSSLLDTAILNGTEWKKPGEKQQPYTSISLPLFSKDRKLVFIYKDYHNLMADPGDAETGIEVYVKVKKGVWRLCGLTPFDKVIQAIISE